MIPEVRRGVKRTSEEVQACVDCTYCCSTPAITYDDLILQNMAVMVVRPQSGVRVDVSLASACSGEARAHPSSPHHWPGPPEGGLRAFITGRPTEWMMQTRSTPYGSQPLNAPR
ncbi:uncharacterized protein ATNIH1004_007942 [Aspergillus tanneri]|uniref:Uncharacterized protein n=1 Tax=Aspergillus tanneri TaxID=1220188 RepID=A0A5M9MPN9_9EURO|nr:uncharacterized protein ATNIH1004_007942 [Aspergillus tanneri]KAA8646509.1 hypothetical protein ATNIH1004_007942 [Aspergillus tanneri]